MLLSVLHHCKGCYFKVHFNNVNLRPPQVRTQSFTPSICYIYNTCFRIVSGFGLLCNLTHKYCLICNFCPSDQSFAADFLQIPRHHGHPCLKLCAWYYQPALGTFTLKIAPMLGAHK